MRALRKVRSCASLVPVAVAQATEGAKRSLLLIKEAKEQGTA